MFSKVAMASRYLLGLMFTIFGANGLMMAITGSGFMPMPPLSATMTTIMTGFMATGYLMTLVALLQFIAGVLLLSGLYINAAIIFLGPIIVNIVLIHVFAEPEGLGMAIFTAVLFVVLIVSRWADFKQLLKR